MKKLLLLIPFVIIFGFVLNEITGEKFPIGSTILHDSSSATFTINKGAYINGTVRTPNLLFKELGGSVAEDINGLLVSSNYLTFQTIAENPVMVVDSANGLNLTSGNLTIDNYTKLGGSTAPAIKQVLVKGKVGTGGSTTNIAHGITNYSHIISLSWGLRDDSTDRFIPANYGGTTGLSTGAGLFLNATNVSYFLPTASVNLANDTLKCLIIYRQ